VVRLGDKGSEVLAVQRALSMPLTGQFGADLDSRVRKIQGDAGLGVDGIVGPQTWAAIREFSVEYSKALQHWGKRSRVPMVVVLHHSGGYTREGMERTLNAKKCATNALVTQTGHKVIYGDPFTDLASHAKVINSASFGLDFEHAHGEKWPAVQIEQGGQFIAQWCREHGLAPKINPARPWDGSADHPCRTRGRYNAAGEVLEWPRPRFDSRYGIGLHRQYGATLCPDDLPIHDLQDVIDSAYLAAAR
jgi:hypothetical protein